MRGAEYDWYSLWGKEAAENCKYSKRNIQPRSIQQRSILLGNVLHRNIQHGNIQQLYVPYARAHSHQFYCLTCSVTDSVLPSAKVGCIKTQNAQHHEAEGSYWHARCWHLVGFLLPKTEWILFCYIIRPQDNMLKPQSSSVCNILPRQKLQRGFNGR